MIRTTGTTTVFASRPTVAVYVEFPVKLLEGPKQFKKKLPGAMRRMAMEGKSFWKAEAGRKLKSSRKKYQDAIEFQVVDDLSFYLSLKGAFVYGVETGSQPIDMKPRLLKNALPWPPKRRKFPKAIAASLPRGAITKYRIIPLNVNRYINMTKPTVFRTIHDQTTIALSGPNAGKAAWQHPGLKGAKLVDAVVDEMTNVIIPKHMSKLLQETF